MTDTEIINWLQANAATVYFRDFDSSVSVVTKMVDSEPSSIRRAVRPNLREAVIARNPPPVFIDPNPTML